MCKQILNFYQRNRKPVAFLKRNKASIGQNLKITPPLICPAGIECRLLTIGDNCNFSAGVMLIFHDGSNIVPEHLGLSKKGSRKYGRIVIGNNVFVGAKTIILPNVDIVDNVIIGAGSLVTKSIPSNCVYGGVPAHKICDLDEYCRKNIGNFIDVENAKELDLIVPQPPKANNK